jgi:protein-arginine kinase activator protein McsA
MFVTKTITQKVETEKLENIKCDICGRNLVKGKDKEQEIAVASIRLSRATIESVKESGFDNPSECESSDFCEKCYKKIIEFVKKKLGGKVPSYYYSEDQSIEETLKELFL